MRDAPEIVRRGSATSSPIASPRLSAAFERAERIRFSLPLLLLAGASLVISFVLYSETFGGHATRVPLWVLAFSIGLIASVGGTASLLVGDFSGEEWRAEAESSEEFVVIDRARWREIQAVLATADPSSVEGGGWPSIGTADPAAPEWSEPSASPTPSELSAPRPPEALRPPAPMAVSHGLDSLATEVERMVAELNTAASEPPVAGPVTDSLRRRSSPTPRTAVPPPPPTPSETPPPRAGEPSTTSAAGRSGAKPSNPSSPRTARPSAGESLARPEAVGPEYRALLDELDRRSTAARPTSAAVPSLSATTDRCVGCDAKVPPSERGSVCSSCHAAMCASCRARSVKEGFPGLCALCAILEETARRDRPGTE
jgi:hypothetical protein